MRCTTSLGSMVPFGKSDCKSFFSRVSAKSQLPFFWLCRFLLSFFLLACWQLCEMYVNMWHQNRNKCKNFSWLCMSNQLRCSPSYILCPNEVSSQTSSIFSSPRSCRGGGKDTRGTAFVVYEDIYDAKNAVDHLSGFNVANRYLIVLYYQQAKMSQKLDQVSWERTW